MKDVLVGQAGESGGEQPDARPPSRIGGVVDVDRVDADLTSQTRPCRASLAVMDRSRPPASGGSSLLTASCRYDSILS
jgi:hypothetical protein